MRLKCAPSYVGNCVTLSDRSRDRKMLPTISRVEITLLARKSLPLSWIASGNWLTIALAFKVSWCTMREAEIWCSCVSVVIFSKMATTTYAVSPAAKHAARAPVFCGEVYSASCQLHSTSTSGAVRCAAPSHVGGCCSRGDVWPASGQLCGSIVGPGLGCLLLERLSADYGKKSKLRFTVWVTEE